MTTLQRDPAHGAACVDLDAAALIIRGPDAGGFLQGQISCDLKVLAADRSLLGGYHTPQGRTIALLRLIEWAPGEIVALVERELAATVLQRLRRFVLRSRVTLADESAAFMAAGLLLPRSSAPGHGAWPADGTVVPPESALRVVGLAPGADAGANGRWRGIALVRREGRGAELAASRAALLDALGVAGEIAAGALDPGNAAAQAWQAARIAAGEPTLGVANSEAFVAQMLNLDLLGAVSFEKGCYAGQEVIARAHWRGRVKRRMQRFALAIGAAPAPGTTGLLGDGRSARIVDALMTAPDRCECLAVTALEAGAAVGDGGAEAPEDGRGASSGAAASWTATALPLPYALP